MVLLALICFYFICFGPARSTSDCFLAFFSRRTPSAKGPFLVFLKQRSVCFSSWLPSPCAYFLLFIEWFFKNTNKGPLAPFCHEGANKIRASASFPFLARLACRLLASSPALLFLEKQCALLLRVLLLFEERPGFVFKTRVVIRARVQPLLAPLVKASRSVHRLLHSSPGA